MATKRRGYPHTPEECGDHDLDIDGECNGCGKDALDCIEEERAEAIADAMKRERNRIIHVLNCAAGTVNVEARDVFDPIARERGEAVASALYAMANKLAVEI